MTSLIGPCPDCGEPRTTFGPQILHATHIFEVVDGEPPSRTVCPAMAEVQRILAEANTPIEDGDQPALHLAARYGVKAVTHRDWARDPEGTRPVYDPDALVASGGWSRPAETRTPASFGRFGVEMALPAPAEEKLGIDIAGDRVVTVACEIRDGVVHLLTTHELDR